MHRGAISVNHARYQRRILRITAQTCLRVVASIHDVKLNGPNAARRRLTIFSTESNGTRTLHRLMTAAHLSSTAFNAIIVGMPRSGTSLTAGIFARKNYYVASDTSRELRPGDQFNPFGYWEAEPLTNYNAALLGMAGFGFHNTCCSIVYRPMSRQGSRRSRLRPGPQFPASPQRPRH